MRISCASLTIALIAAVAAGQSANPTKGQAQLLLELFTSEGCSSCPPADMWLQQVDNLQPIPGVNVIVLSEHVDYWDHDGWKDPYSMAQFTSRQSAYVKALGLSTAYTPQVIVNGNGELRLSEPLRISQLLMKAASFPTIPVSISSLSVEGAFLRAHIGVHEERKGRSADIFAAVALGHAESQVARGENGGKHLSHVAVVQELVKVGKLEKGKVFSENIQIKLQPNTGPRNLRLIVFVQEPEYGRVLGAARQDSSLTAK